ncbi:MAG TPA: GntR family transcriptional regulator [Acidimicrobiia bacterium]|nr:GntR family transcriptional regulator [Acidimicrobiia bacterium]
MADVLRQSILTGDIEPGERIKEEDVAAVLGVSRTPVREALLVLAAERLIDLPTNRGARATVRVLDEGEHQLIYHMRALLEGYGAGRAAERVNPGLLAELEASCEALASIPTGEAARLIEENNRFHRLISQAADAERLSFIVDTLLQVPFAYKADSWSDQNFHHLALEGHRRIVEALRQGDAEAATAEMRRHLEQVSEDTRRLAARHKNRTDSVVL